MLIFESLEVSKCRYPFQLQSVLHFFFHVLQAQLGKKRHDVLFPLGTIHCVISYGKNCGRLGEGSGEEKIYALMSNSFSKKEMLTLQVCFSAGNI